MIGRVVYDYKDPKVDGYNHMEVDDYIRTPAILTDIVFTIATVRSTR
ncbi:S-methyl-5'-thioadenosine phosphorylase [Venturia inaequalis]|nr:S-methyl-5'-thioadenosine phosphorylase [Venturia inaequalis]